ncbi:MAG: LysE family translocator [Kineosporiaceae bacterium]
MTWTAYGGFLGFAVVLVVIPGPDVAMTTGGRRSARRSLVVTRRPVTTPGNEPRPRRQRFSGWRQGFLSNVTNSKVLVFHLAVLPQFLGARPAVTSLMLLSATDSGHGSPTEATT